MTVASQTGNLPTSTALLDWRILPAGDSCLVIEFGTVIDPSISRTVYSVAAYLQERRIDGIVDIVPAFTTLGLHYRPEKIRGEDSPFENLRAQIDILLKQGIVIDDTMQRVVDVPVCYGGEFGPDLDSVAQDTGLTVSEVVRLHAASSSSVYMIGFAPGHPYAGMLDPLLAVPRRATPRTAVAAGSVAIANRLTIIYPMHMPGGWNLIGRTPLKLFDPQSEPPCLLRPGDRLRFVPISLEQYYSMQEQS